MHSRRGRHGGERSYSCRSSGCADADASSSSFPCSHAQFRRLTLRICLRRRAVNAASKLTDEILPTLLRVHATFEASIRSLAGLAFSRSSNKTTHFRVVTLSSLTCAGILYASNSVYDACASSRPLPSDVRVARLRGSISSLRSCARAGLPLLKTVETSGTTRRPPTPIDAPSLRAESCLTLEIVDIYNCCRVITDA
mgnify:CR=1 FL=1